VDNCRRAGRTRAVLRIQVNGYSSYKLNERPADFVLDGHRYTVTEILDQWYSPDSTYFKVCASDGNYYILRYHNQSDEWTLESYMRPTPPAWKNDL
jgi:hypothetical protein